VVEGVGVFAFLDHPSPRKFLHHSDCSFDEESLPSLIALLRENNSVLSDFGVFEKLSFHARGFDLLFS